MRSLVIGAAAGAAAVWFLDPNDGARRRNVVRDKALKYVRQGGAEAERQFSYAAGQAKGVAHNVAPSGDREDAAERLNDPALARKVESEIFRATDAPKGQVSVNVENGVVYLRGELDDAEKVRTLAEDAAKVDGVRGVENLLKA
ncbi:MAG: BON domain-containing protein [Thermoleophilaceae bacterium]